MESYLHVIQVGVHVHWGGQAPASFDRQVCPWAQEAELLEGAARFGTRVSVCHCLGSAAACAAA